MRTLLNKPIISVHAMVELCLKKLHISVFLLEIDKHSLGFEKIRFDMQVVEQNPYLLHICSNTQNHNTQARTVYTLAFPVTISVTARGIH